MVVLPNMEDKEPTVGSEPWIASERLAHVPEYLRIRVLEADNDFIVIHKPPNLRSVPGNAAATRCNKKRPRDEKVQFTAQEAWIEAIRSLRKSENEQQSEADYYIAQLGASDSSLASVPRKYNTFRRYLERNQRRIFVSNDKEKRKPYNSSEVDLETTSRDMFDRIEVQQRQLMNRPEPTSREESAFGQLLILLGYENTSSRSNQKLYVIHRLDCETSGVMVFARNQPAASFLSQAWRDREQVSKTYLARVYDWPPWQTESETSGQIDLPLAPSDERLKWKVCETTGKPSKTLWQVVSQKQDDICSPVMLQLTPVTGRTHQLRIHCAAHSRGIVGDSLYGDARGELGRERLCLHAYKLSFPHPTSSQQMDFVADPDW